MTAAKRTLADTSSVPTVESIANLAQSRHDLIDQPVRRGSSGGNADAFDAFEVFGIDLVLSFDQKAVRALFLADGEQLDAVR